MSELFIEIMHVSWGLALMAVFLGVLWHAYRPKNRARFETCSRIPFLDSDVGGGEER
ncbi:MAG: cbb3-type cytochrome c oxidase subunit 3 [Alphaproteobacteria bacterium]|nr:cbb3-type cytochrome c oxidase subunit 3 [Alphaproteobacteria bacterium]